MTDPGRPEYAILVDATADQLPLRLPAKLRDDIQARAMRRYTFSIGVIQGKARTDLFWNARRLGMEKLAHRPDNQRDDASSVATCVADRSDRVEATVPGSDVLSALQAASDELHSRGGGDRPVIAVVSNGLANTGALDLRQAFSGDGSAKEVARLLAAAGELPDLRGVEVHLYHLGQTLSGPFEQQHNRVWLEQVWREICVAAGGVACEVVLQTGDADDRPRHAPADFPFTEPRRPAPPTCKPPSGRCDLPSALLFDPGSWALRADADDLLRPIASRLRAGGEHVLVKGHTASWGSLAYRDDLSRRRASAVTTRLTQLGVDPGRMAPIGVGNRERVVNDVDRAVHLIESLATRNRRVELVFTR